MTYRLPPLSTLRVFEAAARHLSFKSAADELGLTPSAVSRSVQALEDWIGNPLFARGNRTIVLTDVGTAYAAQVRAALDLLAQATRALPGRGARGTLSISAAPTFGLRWLMPRLGRFKARHPDIALTLDTTHRPVEFPRDGIDLAIRMGGGPWPDLDALHLVTESLAPVCAPELASRVRTIADLMSAPLLHVTSVRDDWACWAAARGSGDLDLRGGLRFDTIQYALNAAAQGLGIALGRRPLVDPDLEAGTLVEVLGPPVPAATAYWLVCAPASLARPEVRIFRDWIRGELAAEPAADSLLPPV
ncbi:transcriptional regulator GcvA [Azospirillum agricola]|uniref:transcriptional regulator GcvA n=1 Tax=Azospirillum agricola TaxID=1720247 RepID=UPI000A0EF74C|nr:transcriptional regulator GcvA [Azospirillum agricola]SMH62647.1 DNA-binding transcriptional regulator, LysR family [Azospirillum lipoferum]